MRCGAADVEGLGSSTWVTRRGTIVVEDGSFVYVEPAERDGPEEDGPDAWGDLLEPYVVSAE